MSSIPTDKTTAASDLTPDGGKKQALFSRGKIYQVGSLKYSLYGLVTLFVWLLWGDFCYMMLESILPRIPPLIMKHLNASNQLIGIMCGSNTGSIAGIFSILAMPALCVMSDRHRGRYGRRIPFLVMTSPFAAVFLILIGYYDSVGTWIHSNVIANFIHVSPNTVTLIIFCSILVIFNFFNCFMSAMYNFLVADVVPQEVMGRFMSFFRTVGIVAAIFFNKFIFGKWETHRHEIFLGVGIIYLVTFLLMCWRVKEGEYPPPEPLPPKSNPFKAVAKYLKECFSIPLYLWIFLMVAFLNISYCVGPFSMLFYTDVLKFTMDDIGNYVAIIYALMAFSMIPAGFLCDKFHIVRITPISLALVAMCHFGMYFFVHDKASLYIGGISLVVPSAMVGLCSSTIGIMLLPKEKYGQFMSALGIVFSLGVILGNWLSGLFFDFFPNYQLILIWNGGFEVLACIFGLLIIREWKRHGGMKKYIPPTI